MSNYIEFPLDFQPGLGYSPAAAGPVGGWSYTPGPGFFGKQPMNSLLPNGSTPTSNQHFFGKSKKSRSFGYPLLNRPSESLNMQMFPRYPPGAGNTPGGSGGQFLQGLPSASQYWGFGKRMSRKRTSRKRMSRKRISRKHMSRKRISRKRMSRKLKKF
jgi:hypothetical protein